MSNRLDVIVIGADAPGIAGTVFSPKDNSENREFNIIGVDINQNAPGRFLCDKFYQISPKPAKELFDFIWSNYNIGSRNTVMGGDSKNDEEFSLNNPIDFIYANFR